MTATILLPVLAFMLGFCLARANSCTVAATERFVVERKADQLAGLAVAAAAAGTVLGALAIWHPAQFQLPVPLSQLPLAAAGGTIMGLGALANRGCMLGSVSQLGRGNLNYLLTLVGLALALLATGRIYDLPMRTAEQSLDRMTGGAAGPLFLAVFAAMILYGIVRLISGKRRSMPYLFLIGIIGAVLFATNPYWSYLATIGRAVRGDFMAASLLADFSAVTLFLGATFSAWLRDRLDVQQLALAPAAGCLIGGFGMGMGAQLIPGGNDTLLLWTIPGLATYGAIGYLAMVAAIALGMYLQQAVLSRKG